MSVHPQPDPGWLSILASRLSAKATNQFRRGLRNTSCQLFDEIILPNIFVPGLHSISVATRKKSVRDHYRSWWWGECVRHGHADLVDPSEQMLFTNALWPCTEDQDGVLYHAPKQRVCFGGPHVFTFEFDQKNLGFFEQQCAWMRSKAKKDTDCAMGDVYKALSGYADFCGLTVVWSGNKSFHIHVIFDPALLLKQTPSLLNCYPRDGFISHWQALKDIVVPILGPNLDGVALDPDPALQNPDTYRRLPLGTRQHDDENFFGFPVGTQVPQLVMWEKFRKQAAVDATAMFFSASLFTSVQAQAKAASNCQRSAAIAKALPSIFTNDELEYFAAKIRETFPEGAYPEFVRFEHGWSDGWRAMFRNHAGDNSPTSVMKEQYAGVHISGANPLELSDGSPRLEQSLGECFAQWRRDIHAPVFSVLDDGDPDEDDDSDAPSMITHDLEQGHATGTSEIEQRFAREARSRASTGRAMRRFFREALMNPSVWVKGPEGSGKTTQLMKMLPRRLQASGRIGRSRRAMFAFGDYVSAEEKCEAFNQMQIALGTSYRGMVISSFSRLYEKALAALGMPGARIDNVGAAQKGCASLWAAIEKHQPEVLRWMADHHEEAYRSIGDRWPVFFTVHAVAEQWKSCTYSRLMWGRNFWHHVENKLDSKERDDDVRGDTGLALLVHDEIDASKVVAIEPTEIVEWVRNLVVSDPGAWDPLSTSLAETYASYDRFKSQNPLPLVRGVQVQIDFDKAREIFHLGVEQWQDLVLNDVGAYEEGNPNKPIYRNCVIDNHRWVAKPRMWWRGSFTRPVADTVVVLTTEMLPTAAIERADPEGFSIFSLETPLIGRDTVDVHLARTVTSGKMAKTCAEFQKKLSPHNPDAILVVSDSVKALIKESRTHMSARGANLYIGRHVLQTMPFMHPVKHEILLALNAYTGRDDCVALYHLDRFNQTAGRNMGFRKQGGATHTLVITPRLYDFLMRSHGWFFSRYDLLVHLDKRQREYLKAKAVARTTTVLASVHPNSEQNTYFSGLTCPILDEASTP